MASAQAKRNYSRDAESGEHEVGSSTHTTSSQAGPRSLKQAVGLPVTNTHGQRIGKIEDVLLDLDTGRVVGVVVSSGGFLGLGDTRNTVPPGEFRTLPGREGIQLNLSRAALQAGPRYEADEAAAPRDGMRMKERRELPAAATTEEHAEQPARADNTARNQRDRDGVRPDAMDQSNSDADLKTTAAIRQDIVSRDGLSLNARNVKIITAGGRVTLRGPVNTLEEKRVIVGIATRVAGLDRVTDELEVRAP